MDFLKKVRFGVHTWLWLILIIVLIAGGISCWLISGGKSTTVKTSPTPTKSGAISPSAKTSSSPTTGKTSTPSATSTPTPATTPPTGWKTDSQTLSEGRNVNGGGTYTLYMKNGWNSVRGGDAEWQSSSFLYGTNTSCAPNGGYGTDVTTFNTYCLFKVSVDRSQTTPNSTDNIYYYQTLKQNSDFPGKNYIVLTFTSNITSADKQIVLDSFKLTQ